MRIVDLTHAFEIGTKLQGGLSVRARSTHAIALVPLDALVVMATFVDLSDRCEVSVISREDIAEYGLSGIAGCILATGWSDACLKGHLSDPPKMSIDAAAYLLESGVRTVASDFPIGEAAADLLMHNHCLLVYSVSGLDQLTRKIVRLIALPLKYSDAFSAEARVIALEE